MSTPADQLRFVPDAPAAPTAGLRFVPDTPAEPEGPASTQPASPAWRPSDPLGAALYEVAGPISAGFAGTVGGGARGVADIAKAAWERGPKGYPLPGLPTEEDLTKAAADIEDVQERTRFQPRTAVGRAAQIETKPGQAIGWLGQEQVGERVRKATGSAGLAAAADVGTQLLAGGILSKAVGAGANAVGRVARSAPYAVEAESTAPRGPTTVEGEATPINRRGGLPNPNAPAGGAGRPLPGGGTPGGGEGAGAGPEPRQLPYHPADPTIVPARLPTAPRRTQAQSASGLRNGRMLDPVLIDGRTGRVIDHPAMEEPKAAPGEPEAAAGVANEDSGGAPPPQVPIDSPPIGGGLPAPAHAARAAILRRILGPGARVRLSAITGNALDAADDYAVSGVNQPAGQAAKLVVDSEWPALVRYGHRLVRDVGGTPGMDKGDLERRGKTLVAPVEEGLRPWFKQRKKALYDTANERGKTLPPTRLEGVDVLLDDPTFAQGLAMRGQEGFVKSAKAILAHFRGMPGNEHGFTPDAAEAISKWFNEHWTPQTAWAIGRVVRSIREDVAKAAGDDQFEQARGTHIEEQNLLGEDTGLSDFFEVNPRNPRLRSIAYEDIPGQMLRLPLAQFRQLVELYENPPKDAPASVKRQSKAALGELRAQVVNELLKVGSPSVDEGSWSTPKVKSWLRDHSEQIEILFRDMPGATQMLRDIISGGQIWRINRGYRGSSVQNTNVFSTGLVEKAATATAGAAGLVAGHVIDPTGVVGPMVAGAATAKLADVATKGRIRRRQMNAWGERVVNLDDIAPPEPGAPPAPTKKPRGPRKPPSGGQPQAGGPTPPPAATSAPAPATGPTAGPGPQPAPTPTPAPTAAPGAPPAPTGSTPAPTAPATPGAFPAQGYTRAGYDRAQLAQQLGVDPRAVGDRVLMLHQEADRATQAGDEPRASRLIAERDSLVDASLAKQGLPPRQPPPPPNTLASTETPPAGPASTPPTLASTETPPASAPKAAPVATGPTLASVSEEAPAESVPAAPATRSADVFGENERATAIKRIGELVEQKRTAGTDSLEGAKSVADNLQVNIDELAHYLRSHGVSEAEIAAAQVPFGSSGLMDAFRQSGLNVGGLSPAEAAVVRANDAREGALNAADEGMKAVAPSETGPSKSRNYESAWRRYQSGDLTASGPIVMGRPTRVPDQQLVAAKAAGVTTKAQLVEFFKKHGIKEMKGLDINALPPKRTEPTPLNTTPPPKLPGRDE